MKFQDYIIDSIQSAFNESFKAARAVPEDKLNWKPLDQGRSVLDQVQELAQCPSYVITLVTGGKQETADGDWEKMVQERQTWTTIDACEAVAKERLSTLFEAIRATSDERLKETTWLPYDGGRDFTVAEMMEYPRWNANYHTGQINYIQTLYGDRDMH
jgi:uncharacterized damage-inducible protein DinB